MRWFYNLGVRIYSAGIRAAALAGHSKARLWIDGRKNWKTRYTQALKPESGLLWMHVASLGEFEQGRPLLEAFREQFPQRQIVLTFFSPSGYEIRKNYPGADFIAYLPADTPENARFFIQWLNPSLAVFVKYDLWANYLFTLQQQQVPVLLISALFRKEHIFFKWYGGFWRRLLQCFSGIFLQNGSAHPPVDANRVHVAGDTRVDRVLNLSQKAPENPVVAHFSRGKRTLVAGSTWPKDEALLLEVLKKPRWQDVQVIFAPHDVAALHISALSAQIAEPERTLRYSTTDIDRAEQARWLIIDNIGLLNTLYRYGWVAYIGGGFGKSIHNTLEPAAWGLPILFGPKYDKFEEARQMVADGGAFAVKNAAEMEQALHQLLDPDFYQTANNAVVQFLDKNKGATNLILNYILMNEM